MALKANSKDLTASKVIPDRSTSVPLSEYAKKLDSDVYKRYFDSSVHWHRPSTAEGKSLRAGMSSSRIIHRYTVLFSP